MLLSNIPVSATWVRVVSWSSPKLITAASAKNKSLNSKELVPNAAPSEASGTKAVVAVIVVPSIVDVEVNAALAAIVEPKVTPPPSAMVMASSPSVYSIRGVCMEELLSIMPLVCKFKEANNL